MCHPEKVIYTYVFSFEASNYVAAEKSVKSVSVDREVITCSRLDFVLDLYEDHFWNLDNMGIKTKEYLKTKAMMLACKPLVICLTQEQLTVLTSSMLLVKPRYDLFNPVLYPDLDFIKLEGDVADFVVADLMERFEETINRREKKRRGGVGNTYRLHKPAGLENGFGHQ